MKVTEQESWIHKATGEDGNCILFGVNIFDYIWIDAEKKALVVDPLYEQPYNFKVYYVEIDGTKKYFAAGEFSACVWGFYIMD